MSTFVELNAEEMDDVFVILQAKSHQWRYSGKKDCELYARYYETLAEKFLRKELDDR